MTWAGAEETAAREQSCLCDAAVSAFPALPLLHFPSSCAPGRDDLPSLLRLTVHRLAAASLSLLASLCSATLSSLQQQLFTTLFRLSLLVCIMSFFGARPRMSADDVFSALAPFMAEHYRLLDERKEMKAEISALKEQVRALQLHCGITPPPSPSPPSADKNCADELAVVRPPTPPPPPPPRW